MTDLIEASVPCNGCTACCREDLIILHPELGDRAVDYLTQRVINPISGRPAVALRHKPGGGCIYLGPTGCSIHGRAPAICREFDCRKLVERFGAAERKRMVMAGLASQAVFDAGRKRLKNG